MKDIIFTSARVNQCNLEYDLLNSTALYASNLRWEGEVTIKFTTSGDFTGIEGDEITKQVLGKMLASGLFSK